jgi:hypothetical protein
MQTDNTRTNKTTIGKQPIRFSGQSIPKLEEINLIETNLRGLYKEKDRVAGLIDNLIKNCELKDLTKQLKIHLSYSLFISEEIRKKFRGLVDYVAD